MKNYCNAIFIFLKYGNHNLCSFTIFPEMCHFRHFFSKNKSCFFFWYEQIETIFWNLNWNPISRLHDGVHEQSSRKITQWGADTTHPKEYQMLYSNSENGVSGNKDFPHFINENSSSDSCANLCLDGTDSSSNRRKQY